jgi:hypothetical protein
MPSGEAIRPDELEAIPRIELVSLYMNRYAAFDEAQRRAYEAEFRRRGLPLPVIPPPNAAAEAPQAKGKRALAAKAPIDQRTFLSYVLLIYTLTGLVYSWIFLVTRLVRKDFGGHSKHVMIQTIISIAYIALEGIVLMLLGED